MDLAQMMAMLFNSTTNMTNTNLSKEMIFKYFYELNNDLPNVSDTNNYLNIKVVLLWISLITIVIGVLTNLISLIAFLDPKTLSSTNVYLACLCACDCIALICLLINSVLYSKFTFYGFYSGIKFIMFFYPYIYPLTTTSQIASIYLTISVSLNQFLIIAYSKTSNPNRNRQLKYQEIKKAFSIVLIIIIMSILFCLPYWFQFKYTDENGLETTAINNHPQFKKVVHLYLYLPFACIIPFVVLIITNAYLISTLEIASRRKNKLIVKKSFENTKEQNGLVQKEVKGLLHAKKKESKFESKNKSLMLIAVVFFFLICQLPTLLLNLIESLDQSYKSKWYYVHLVEFSKLLLIINLSFNFAIFYLFSKRFRQTLKDIICRKPKRNDHFVI